MTFRPAEFENFVATDTPSRQRLFPQYGGWKNDFDIIVIGSGMGGGVLADDLGDRLASQKRILVLEAGSYLYPTHVFNICRFPNADVAGQFRCKNFWQREDGGAHYIHERPQMNFGGRSVFWSGLIPRIQQWELDFFPGRVKQDLEHRYLAEAGVLMNESRTMGETAQAIVERFRQTSLNADFEIRETPRALHQPYLARENAPPVTEFFVEPTGVFNTAELLINNAGLTPGVHHGDNSGMFILLNHYVEDIQRHDGNRYELVVRNTLDGTARHFHAGTVVLAGGSIESPKLLRRSSLFHSLPDPVKGLVGRGLTDHPTTDWIRACVTHIGPREIGRDSHAKIVFYSRGHRDGNGRIRFPFNVEMNVNHEYWHLRDNDPTAPHAQQQGPCPGASPVEIKFSFGNCLDDGNEIKPAPPFGYVPEIEFRNLQWVHLLAEERFPALAGWQKSIDDIWNELNGIATRIFAEFQHNGAPVQVQGRFGQGNGFGFGTVHHAIGTLRMPHRTRFDAGFQNASVVDEDLQVIGAPNLYVCDMSVMPFSSAANPVRTLVGLALRMSHRFG